MQQIVKLECILFLTFDLIRYNYSLALMEVEIPRIFLRGLQQTAGIRFLASPELFAQKNNFHFKVQYSHQFQATSSLYFYHKIS